MHESLIAVAAVLAFGGLGVVNAGVVLGITGDAKSDDVGILVALIRSF